MKFVNTNRPTITLCFKKNPTPQLFIENSRKKTCPKIQWRIKEFNILEDLEVPVREAIGPTQMMKKKASKES